jgi:hypothetical protein
MWAELPDELVARVVAQAEIEALPVIARLDVRSRRVIDAPPNRLKTIALLAQAPFSLRAAQIMGDGHSFAVRVSLGAFCATRAYLDDAQAATLANAISGGALATCDDLCLGHNGIGPSGAVALADAFCVGARNLRMLDLAFNRIGDAGIIAMTRACALHGALPRLESLGLDGGDPVSQFGDEGLIVLCRSGSFGRLKWLFLEGNEFTDYGMDALAECLESPVFESLTTISYPTDGIDDDLLERIESVCQIRSIEIMNRDDGPSEEEDDDDEDG